MSSIFPCFLKDIIGYTAFDYEFGTLDSELAKGHEDNGEEPQGIYELFGALIRGTGAIST